jgi:hypothetical protein
MNYNKARNILDINDNEEVNIEKIKRQYRIKALMYHPDKNKTPNAAEKFVEVKNAYEYLVSLEQCNYNCETDEDDNDDEYDYEDGDVDKSSYRWKMYSFIKSILKKESNNAIFYGILQKISCICEDRAISLLESLDKSILLKVFDILKKYKDAFHFNDEFIQRIDGLVKKRSENDECIVLNPSLEDLFENNLYKLSVGNQTYIVPLWHHELVYDNSGNDIYVKCFPILPENMEIDNKNNLHVNMSCKVLDLWEKTSIKIDLSKNKSVEFCPSELKFSSYQTIIFTDGISKINTQNVYEVSSRALIYLHITIYA